MRDPLVAFAFVVVIVSGCEQRCEARLDCPKGKICSADGVCVTEPEPSNPSVGGEGEGEADEGEGEEGEGEGEGECALDPNAVTQAPYPICAPPCATADDCAQGDDAIVDADNWRCFEGGCLYLGCLSDAECAATFPEFPLCQPGITEPGCVATCTQPSDCAGTASVIDEDNWSCASGRCTFQGCNCDAECTELAQEFGDYQAVCRARTGDVPTCYLACSTVDDCVIDDDPAFSADNFRCEQGACIDLGCLDTEECAATALLQVCAGP